MKYKGIDCQDLSPCEVLFMINVIDDRGKYIIEALMNRCLCESVHISLGNVRVYETTLLFQWETSQIL